MEFWREETGNFIKCAICVNKMFGCIFVCKTILSGCICCRTIFLVANCCRTVLSGCILRETFCLVVFLCFVFCAKHICLVACCADPFCLVAFVAKPFCLVSFFAKPFCLVAFFSQNHFVWLLTIAFFAVFVSVALSSPGIPSLRVFYPLLWPSSVSSMALPQPPCGRHVRPLRPFKCLLTVVSGAFQVPLTCPLAAL